MNNTFLDYATIFLKVTPNCNLSCFHCYAHKLTKEMRMQFDSNFYNFVSQFNHISLVFHGGEPLYYGASYIISLINSLNNNIEDKISQLSITSNLVVPKEELKKISPYFGSIGTSWNSGNIRFTNENQIKVWENNIKYWKSLDKYKSITVNVTLTEDLVKYSESQIKDLILYFDSLNIDYINLEFLYINKPYSQEFKDNISKFLSTWYKLVKELKVNFVDELLESIKENKKGLRCGIFCHRCSTTTWSLDVFGNILGCPNDENTVFGKLSNPESYQLKALYKERIKERIVERLISKECLACKNVGWCNGGCIKVNKFGCIYPKDLFESL